jgi:hypothetical protein
MADINCRCFDPSFSIHAPSRPCHARIFMSVGGPPLQPPMYLAKDRRLISHFSLKINFITISIIAIEIVDRQPPDQPFENPEISVSLTFEATIPQLRYECLRPFGISTFDLRLRA